MVEYLSAKKEDLMEEKKLADAKNEDLKTQLKAQEDIAEKRLMNRLQREKSAEVKELLANEEIAKQSNEDYATKLTTERANYDELLASKLELEEQLLRKEEDMALDKANVEETDALLAELKKQIEAEQAEVDTLQESVDEKKVVKKEEEETHRRVEQENTALRAKLEFIEANYDYTSTATEMNLDIFSQIMRSNQEVNETVSGFVGKVGDVKKEVTKILAKRQAF